MIETSGPSIYEYLDHRKFLADFFRHRRSLNRSYSYRVFCRMAGINSPGYVSEVIGGSRKLTPAYLTRFAQGLGLDVRERDYFERLVAFGQAEDDADRQALYGRVVESLPLQLQGLRRSQLEYFSAWHHVAVREALAVHRVTDDGASLAPKLRPALTAAQARASIVLLSRLGLIARDTRDPEGPWRATHASLVTRGDASQSLLFNVFRKEMIARAGEALDRFPADLQDSTCVTMSVSAEGFRRLRDLKEEFHRRVLEVVQADRGEDRVVQMNVQIFPLTEVPDAEP